MKDKLVREIIEKEAKRQLENIELIASENYASKDVLEAAGSLLTNKYAEGYPGKRYYGGCKFVDEIEELARTRACELFKADHVNVQPHSGSQANMGVYMSVLKPGDTVLGMDLCAGGHLTHGHPLNFSGTLYNFVPYDVDKVSECIDYEKLRALAIKHKPKLIVAGASAYPRIIDFKKFGDIAKEVGAYLMVDMAHIAGLVAADLHPSPIPYADFVTTTTHKTLRGPRGGMIFCKGEHAKLLDRNVFPGIQGGPLMHIIAAKAICLKEAMDPSFVDYQRQVIKNMKQLVSTLQEEGFRIISNGTDNHLCLVDVLGSIGMSGKEAEKLLDEAGITCNKNTIPFDTQKPFVTSGIRLGTAAMTTRGFVEEDFVGIGKCISHILKSPEDAELRKMIKSEIVKKYADFVKQHDTL